MLHLIIRLMGGITSLARTPERIMHRQTAYLSAVLECKETPKHLETTPVKGGPLAPCLVCSWLDLSFNRP